MASLDGLTSAALSITLPQRSMTQTCSVPSTSLATPLGDETLWSKRAIAAIEEPPFGSASAHEESGSDVEQTDNDIQDSEQDAAEPQS